MREFSSYNGNRTEGRQRESGHTMGPHLTVLAYDSLQTLLVELYHLLDIQILLVERFDGVFLELFSLRWVFTDFLGGGLDFLRINRHWFLAWFHGTD
jgi:hypothetical protein